MSESIPSRPTLKDVARLAGVSHMTVSRVVQGGRQVKPSTARKVREVIEKIGYRPDPILSALSSYRNQRDTPVYHGVIAFLDCDGMRYTRRLLEGVREEAASLGYDVEDYSLLPGKNTPEGLSRMLFHRGIRGVLFGPTDVYRSYDGWNWDEFAAVSIGSLKHGPRMHTVAMDYFQGAASGCELLVSAGFRRIGFAIANEIETRTRHRWLGGYLAGLQGYGRPFIFRWSKNWSYEMLAGWAVRHRLDAVITVHRHVEMYLRPLGIPSFFLNEVESGPGMPRVAFSPSSIGSEGVRFLHNLLRLRDYGLPKKAALLSLPGEWVDYEAALAGR